ncbi:MAG: hypothetical protein GY715_16760 [Planctomycetes bacterium]|nr:hypothetical protein [Planctomycetota bacterium]
MHPRGSRTLLTLLVLAFTGGCAAPPLRPAQIVDPDLRVIHDRFEEIMRDARRDPEIVWHAGPIGNLIVNYVGAEHYGLCYDWQELVYDEVLPTVEAIGWTATGIKINEDTKNEHHGVLVFDPRRVEAERILETPETAPAWVLDAWRRGRADIYRVNDWLALATTVYVEPELEDLPYVPPEDEEVASGRRR